MEPKVHYEFFTSTSPRMFRTSCGAKVASQLCTRDTKIVTCLQCRCMNSFKKAEKAAAGEALNEALAPEPGKKSWRRLAFVISAGEKTCASEPGKFCEFCGVKKFGTLPWCMLFNQELGTLNGKDDGWLERLDECRKAEERT